jgi:hypothetical protein
MQAAAFGVRASQRIEKDGFRKSLRANVADAVFTTVTFSMGGALLRTIKYGKPGLWRQPNPKVTSPWWRNSVKKGGIGWQGRMALTVATAFPGVSRATYCHFRKCLF